MTCFRSTRTTSRRLILVFLFSSFYFFLVTAFPYQDVSDYENRLKKLITEINSIQTKIRTAEQQETSILSSLEKIGFNKRLIEKELKAFSLRLNKANLELKEIEKNTAELEEKLEAEKDAVKKILVAMYKFGRMTYLDFMIQVDNIGSLISENKNLSLLANTQKKIIDGYIEMLHRLNQSQKDLENKKREISQLIQETRQKEEEYSLQEKQNQTLLDQIKQNRNIHLQTLEELQQRAEQLQDLMKKLLKEEITLPFPIIPLYEMKGKLPWPITGKVASRFGLEHHPKFNTKTQNNGIEITPEDSITVKSIHRGIVAFSDYFPGYGNLIIIDHGLTYYSLYGHCSELIVKKGDPVKEEQAIAMVGDISSIQGTTLYFEIRHKIDNQVKALDPLQWLRKR
ncbi:MAG: peptidoglycan DD-metalloendopeptidase family protein [Candidatus Aminicenantes bacterium]|nr:peptidoglycan DD-metalloendopeptidase family protein [Candidatus Aminicenantes bacterium]